MSMSVRERNSVEGRLVSEYIATYYAKFPSATSVPLGRVEEMDMAKYGYLSAIHRQRPWRPEADGYVVLPNYLVLIEAKVWSPLLGLQKLPMYASLVPDTPELKKYMPREVIMELVVGISAQNLETMAQRAGVRVRVFTPEWVIPYLNYMDKYQTREYKRERQRILETRRILGVE